MIWCAQMATEALSVTDRAGRAMHEVLQIAYNGIDTVEAKLVNLQSDLRKEASNG
jgi:hypothetical protein